MSPSTTRALKRPIISPHSALRHVNRQWQSYYTFNFNHGVWYDGTEYGHNDLTPSM